MAKRSRIISTWNRVREKTPPTRWIWIVILGICFAYLLRNPFTSLITGGKSFDGRNAQIQIILMVIFSLFFSLMVLLLYLSYFRFNRVKTFVDRIISSIKDSPKLQLVMLFLLLASIYFSIWQNFTDLDDTAYFGGDTWEYQSMAVNFAYGHGLQKLGQMEPFDTYKFYLDDHHPKLPEIFLQKAGMDDFLRAPAYPFYLGMVYKVFDINPKAAKTLQLLMLVIISASLPLIGRHYWGKNGSIGGLLAGVFYLAANHNSASQLMTEPLISFSIFLILLAFIYHDQHRCVMSACLLGFSLGFAMLVKGSLYLIPVLTGFWMIIRYFKKRDIREMKWLLICTFSAALIILPWVLYASTQSGQFIFITNQGDSQLLADNNELCLDGGWHPEWKENENAFYYHDGIDNKYSAIKVVNFYWHYPDLLPRCLANKLINNYRPLEFMWIFLGLLLLREILRIVNHWSQSKNIANFLDESRIRIPASMWIIVINFFLITLIFHGEKGAVYSRFVAPMDFIFELLCCVYLVIFIRSALGGYLKTNTLPRT